MALLSHLTALIAGALGRGSFSFRACQQLHMLSRICLQPLVFPRLPSVTNFNVKFCLVYYAICGLYDSLCDFFVLTFGNVASFYFLLMWKVKRSNLLASSGIVTYRVERLTTNELVEIDRRYPVISNFRLRFLEISNPGLLRDLLQH